MSEYVSPLDPKPGPASTFRMVDGVRFIDGAMARRAVEVSEDGVYEYDWMIVEDPPKPEPLKPNENTGMFPVK